MLKRIDISGFKSFAKKGSLYFGSRVVGVVGPNGSGKSNVAESFRFVLGEQSMKALRSGKGEDLIWNGSAAVLKANKASVTLVFDNTSRIFAMDVPEITLERAVYRDGQNEYYLNGKQVRLKDITELLASISIGASKHHIISQGQADRMLNASAAERREMLLDSLGLTAVDLKKSEAERNLNKTTAHMKEIEAARRESRPRLHFLEKQVEKFAKAKKVREELLEKSVAYIRAESASIESEGRKLVVESGEPRKTLATLTAKRDELRQRVHAQKDVEHEESLHEAKLSAELDVRRIEDELSAVVRERAKVSARIEIALEPVEPKPVHVQESARVNASANPSLSVPTQALEALKTAENAVSTSVRVSGDYSRAFRELQAALVAFWAAVPKDSHTNTPPSQQHEQHQQSAADNSVYIATLRTQDAELQAKEKTLAQNLADARVKLAEAQASIANLKVASVEGEREILELSASIAELTSRVREFDFAAQNLQNRKDVVKRLQEECEALLGNVFRLAMVKGSVEATGAQGQTLRVREGLALGDAAVSLDQIQRLKIRVEELGGGDEEVEREYADAKQRDDFLQKELSDITTSHDSLITLIAQLESEMNATFTNGLEAINVAFEEFFRSLFGGGEAKLVETSEPRGRLKTASLSDSGLKTKAKAQIEHEVDDEEKTKPGIDIQVHLPKKKVASLAILSGGERALTSIALICALSQVNPPPFIILDETDAALDEANSSRFANMVQTLSHKSQCIVITHNRATMAAAGELYGITMGSDGVSKLLSVKLEEAERVAK